MSGKFITFEGGEGAGKSTQIKRLAARLEGAGHAVVLTREPGGTPMAEDIRKVLLAGLAEHLGPDGEAVLFAAARAEHVERVIRPALRAGKWVLSDRFFDSTHVYQGGAGAEKGTLDALDRLAVGRTRPDLTIVLDLPMETGLARAARRAEKSGGSADRFERDEIEEHEARRQAFLQIAKAEPERVVVIDAAQTEDAASDAIWKAVAARLIEKAA
jgi:dTMP kinase